MDDIKRKPGRPRKDSVVAAPTLPIQGKATPSLSEYLNQPVAPIEMQRIIGISQGAYHSLEKSQPGLFSPEKTALQQLHDYLKRIRDTAAGRLSGIQMQKLVRPDESGEDVTSVDDDTPNITAERAKLVRAQREREVFKLNVLKGQYAPISLLTETLALASSAVVSALDQTQNKLSVECQGLSSDSIAVIQDVLATARNRWVDATQELINPETDQEDSPDDE
jgi:hypothetical protein